MKNAYIALAGIMRIYFDVSDKVNSHGRPAHFNMAVWIECECVRGGYRVQSTVLLLLLFMRCNRYWTLLCTNGCTCTPFAYKPGEEWFSEGSEAVVLLTVLLSGIPVGVVQRSDLQAVVVSSVHHVIWSFRQWVSHCLPTTSIVFNTLHRCHEKWRDWGRSWWSPSITYV